MKMTVIVLDLFSSDGNAPNLLVGQTRSHVENYLSLSLLQSTTIKTFTAQQRALHPTQCDAEEFWAWKMDGLEHTGGGTKGTVGMGPEIPGFWPWKLSPLLQRSQQQQARQRTWLASCMGTQTLLPKKPDSSVHKDRALTLTLPAAEASAPQLLHPHPRWWGSWTLQQRSRWGWAAQSSSIQVLPALPLFPTMEPVSRDLGCKERARHPDEDGSSGTNKAAITLLWQDGAVQCGATHTSYRAGGSWKVPAFKCNHK